MRRRLVSAITLRNAACEHEAGDKHQTQKKGKQTNFNHSGRTPAAFHHSCLFILGGVISHSPSEITVMSGQH